MIIIFLRFYVLKENIKSSHLQFHRVAEKEKFSLSLKKISDVSWITSLLEYRPNFVLLTSRNGKIYDMNINTGEENILFDFKEQIKEFVQTFESGVLCITSFKGKFYISYTIQNDLSEDGVSIIVKRCSLNPKFQLHETIFSQDFPSDIHHGGTLAFDDYGNLYLSLGDGGPQGDPGNYAQNLSSYRGKILRLDDNGKSPKIIAFGLRNPWRFSIHNDQMFIADVGHASVESLYLLENIFSDKLYNCGWNQYEGSEKYTDNPSFPFEETTPPIFEYPNGSDPHTPGRCIIGGYYLDSLNIYVFGDFVSQNVYILQNIEGKWIQVAKKKNDGSITSFGKIGEDLWVLGSGVFSLTISS